MRGGEHLLPTIRVFDAVTGDKVGISYGNPVLMCLDDLHPQWWCPIRALCGTKYESDLISDHFIQIG